MDTQDIQVHEFFSSGLNDEFNSISNITIEDRSFDKGAFGAVFHCIQIDRKPLSTRQVLKIFIDDSSGSARRGYETIVKLQQQIIALHAELAAAEEKPLKDVNALYALPQFSFEGSLNGKLVNGYSANFLSDSEWLLFSRIFDEESPSVKDELRKRFYNLPVQLRLKMAFDIAEGFYYLERLKFIYADLNPKNFFVNQISGKLCLIDYEGGAVNDVPETYGKLGQWLAPEIQEQLLKNNSPIIKVDLNTDTWALAIGVHFLFFNFHPLFFLKTLGQNEIETYLSKNKWPHADKSHIDFRKDTAVVYDRFLSKLNGQIHPSIVDAFSKTINAGYKNPNKRLTSKQWMNIFSELIDRPEIIYFEADKKFSISGVPVFLSWKVEGAELLSINNNIGNVLFEDKMKVNPTQATTYIIKAVSRCGESQKSIDINILPIPIIESLKVPMPDFESKLSLHDFGLAMPPVNILIELNQKGFSIPDLSFITLKKDLTSQINRRRVIFEYPGISGIFLAIKDKINKII